MTSGQRKVHKYIWLLLILIVPVFLVFSIKDLAIFSFEKDSATVLETSKENIISTAENEIVKASLYESHVEIILKTTLKNSSAIVYETDGKDNKSNILGQLTTVGIYKFNINNLPKGIIIYDSLKETEITKLIF